MKKFTFLLMAALCFAACDKTEDPATPGENQDPDANSGATVTATYFFNIDIPAGKDATGTVTLTDADSTSQKGWIFLDRGDGFKELPFEESPAEGWTMTFSGSASTDGKITVNRKADVVSGATGNYDPVAENGVSGKVVYILSERNHK